MEYSLPAPEVKRVKRRWLTMCFAANMFSLVLMGALLVAGFLYASSVLKEYGVELYPDRVEMVFSDGSIADLSSREFLEEEEADFFAGLQQEEFDARFDRFYSEYWESRAWVMPAVVFGVVVSMAILLALPFYILVLMLVYKGWKSLRPLKALARDEASLMPGPAVAVVLCLVPVFNLLWAYVCLSGYAFYGKKLAALKGLAYRGPSLALGLSVAVWFSLESAFDIAAQVDCLPLPWGEYAVLGMMMSLVSGILLFLFARRLSLMIEDFGEISARSHEGLPE